MRSPLIIYSCVIYIYTYINTSPFNYIAAWCTRERRISLGSDSKHESSEESAYHLEVIPFSTLVLVFTPGDSVPDVLFIDFT